jgi:hypothetical protein
MREFPDYRIDEFQATNTLLIAVRDGKLDVFVNDKPVGKPTGLAPAGTIGALRLNVKGSAPDLFSIWAPVH